MRGFICKVIIHTCGEASFEPGTVVRVGGCIRELRTAFGKVESCIYSYETDVRTRHSISTWEEGRYTVFESDWHVWVFETGVVSRVMKLVERLGKSTIFNVGAFMFGPPGSGKSDLAGTIIPNLYGLEVVDLSPDKVLGKYVGESEQKLSKLFSRAEGLQPSELFGDEAENFLERYSRGNLGEGSYIVHQNLVNMFKKKLSEWVRRRSEIFVALTSNKRPETLDQAFLRAGRLSAEKVPYLDKEGLLLLGRLMNKKLSLGLEERKIEEIANYVFSRVLSVADMALALIHASQGESYRSSVERRGVIQFDVDERFHEVVIRDICDDLYGHKHVTVHSSDLLVRAWVVAVYLSKCKKRHIVLLSSHPSMVEDAIDLAESMESYLIVPVHVDENMFYSHMLSAKVPGVIYVTNNPVPEGRIIGGEIRVGFRDDRLQKMLVEMGLRSVEDLLKAVFL